MLEEVLIGGKLEVLDEIVAPDFLNHDALTTAVKTEQTGIETLRQEIAATRAAFPDASITTEDLIAEGDKVVVRARMNATHQGPFMGIPATGKRISGITAISINRVVNGKFVERWNLIDRLSLLQQLGLIPAKG
jgi:predicted ester cyclase